VYFFKLIFDISSYKDYLLKLRTARSDIRRVILWKGEKRTLVFKWLKRISDGRESLEKEGRNETESKV
jgi:hypothetical protein